MTLKRKAALIALILLCVPFCLSTVTFASGHGGGHEFGTDTKAPFYPNGFSSTTLPVITTGVYSGFALLDGTVIIDYATPTFIDGVATYRCRFDLANTDYCTILIPYYVRESNDFEAILSVVPAAGSKVQYGMIETSVHDYWGTTSHSVNVMKANAFNPSLDPNSTNVALSVVNYTGSQDFFLVTLYFPNTTGSFYVDFELLVSGFFDPTPDIKDSKDAFQAVVSSNAWSFILQIVEQITSITWIFFCVCIFAALVVIGIFFNWLRSL